MQESYFEYFEKALSLPKLKKVTDAPRVTFISKGEKSIETRFKYKSPCIAPIRDVEDALNLSAPVGDMRHLSDAIAVHDLSKYRRKKPTIRVLPNITTLIDLIVEEGRGLGEGDTILSLESYLKR